MGVVQNRVVWGQAFALSSHHPLFRRMFTLVLEKPFISCYIAFLSSRGRRSLSIPDVNVLIMSKFVPTNEKEEELSWVKRCGSIITVLVYYWNGIYWDVFFARRRVPLKTRADLNLGKAVYIFILCFTPDSWFSHWMVASLIYFYENQQLNAMGHFLLFSQNTVEPWDLRAEGAR